MTNDEPQNVTDPNGSSPTPPTGQATAPGEYRVPMDDPRVWARGKTYAEILSVGDQAVNALYQVAAMPQQTYQPPAPRGDDIADDEIIDGRRLKQLIAQGAGQAPVDTGTQTQLAQLALSQVQSRHAKVFERYGPEVMGEVAKLPMGLRSVDNLETIVSLVRGRHVDELAEELARTKFANTAGLSARSNGSAPGYPGASGSLLESDELPTMYRERLKKAGLTDAAVRSFCVSSGQDYQQFIRDAKKLSTLIGEES